MNRRIPDLPDVRDRTQEALDAETSSRLEAIRNKFFHAAILLSAMGMLGENPLILAMAAIVFARGRLGAREVSRALAQRMRALTHMTGEERLVEIFGHVHAFVGASGARLVSAEDSGTFSHPEGLIAAIGALEKHLSELVRDWRGLCRLEFEVNERFLHSWRENPPKIAPEDPTLLRQIANVLGKRVEEIEWVLDTHVTDGGVDCLRVTAVIGKPIAFGLRKREMQ